ncbi:MBL fold metallo-hydrolase [Nakamurella sp. YIM 132087]|uniref:MBL fold metallo-hydrolase n=1 Tax=Nakamurella alba TaxID=2665158 RepID=A0A7K1FSF4_9ACTN|nr:MBL fold metallo-hydrolase [Nakamurella alba]MTD17068.1 MBL fold metallo-hydrolase [Nakamurella alba]
MAGRSADRLVQAGWTFVHDGIAVRTSRREHTTSTLILADPAAAEGSEVVLVDPAWDPDELDEIAASLDGLRIAAGFATHAHHDHLLWHPDLGRAPRWSSPMTAALARLHRDELLEQLGRDWPRPLTALFGRVEGLPAGTVPWQGPTIQLITHDAHESGHTALWVPERRVLVAGDMLSDVELPLVQNGSLDAYAVGLATLRPYASAARVVVPGHGRPGDDGAERWRADHRYVDRLMAGLDPEDPRRANHGMEQAHALSLELARSNLAAPG